MNVLVFSMVLVLGQPPQPGQTVSPGPQTVESNCDTCPSAYCDPGCALRSGVKSLRTLAWDWFGPMPQTCYQPRFGCYPGNARDIHRYPAFHGYYYRQPYNYRHYFEYPWHAQPHEPLGYFAYPQVGEGVQEQASPIEAPPVPSGNPGGKPQGSSAQSFPGAPRTLPVGTLSNPWQPVRSTPIR